MTTPKPTRKYTAAGAVAWAILLGATAVVAVQQSGQQAETQTQQQQGSK